MDEPDFSSMSVKELKRFITDRGGDLCACIEKTDLISAAKSLSQRGTEKVGEGEEEEEQVASFEFGSLSKLELAGLECLVLKGKHKPTSVVVILHGYGATNTDFLQVGKQVIRDGADHQWWVFPNGIRPQATTGGREWWPLDLQQLFLKFMSGTLTKEVPHGLDTAQKAVVDLIYQLSKRTALEIGDIVLGGFSQGAMLATHVALHLEENLKALVILSGLLICEEHWKEQATKHAALQVFQSHGTKDPLLAFGLAKQLQGILASAGMAVQFVEFEGEHTVTINVIQKLQEFLKGLE